MSSTLGIDSLLTSVDQEIDQFKPTEQELEFTINVKNDLMNAGNIVGSLVSLKYTTVLGEGMKVVRPGKSTSFIITTYDDLKQRVLHGGDKFVCELRQSGLPLPESCEITITDNEDGTYKATYTLSDAITGDRLQLFVRLNDESIGECPFTVAIDRRFYFLSSPRVHLSDNDTVAEGTGYCLIGPKVTSGIRKLCLRVECPGNAFVGVLPSDILIGLVGYKKDEHAWTKAIWSFDMSLAVELPFDKDKEAGIGDIFLLELDMDRKTLFITFNDTTSCVQKIPAPASFFVTLGSTMGKMSIVEYD